MLYTCAYFKNPQMSLEDAQKAKIEHILKKLQLKRGDTLLDIGSGWGNLLFSAVKKYGVEGVGITLSQEQLKYCRQQSKKMGLSKKLQFKLMNYQDLDPNKYQFDRIVSVGMFEHVGKENMWTYMKCVHDLLREDGLSVLHTITKQDELPAPRWLDKYIFPGGYIPSIRSIIDLLPDYDFRLLDVENLRINYSLTLDEWLKRFDKNKEIISQMYDDKFVRMWRLWLASSSVSFKYGENDLMQIIFSKGVNNHLPINREYLYK
jgi:cyclopropane-fatty-acyl-phospholipid synthase